MCGTLLPPHAFTHLSRSVCPPTPPLPLPSFHPLLSVWVQAQGLPAESCPQDPNRLRAVFSPFRLFFQLEVKHQWGGGWGWGGIWWVKLLCHPRKTACRFAHLSLRKHLTMSWRIICHTQGRVWMICARHMFFNSCAHTEDNYCGQSTDFHLVPKMTPSLSSRLRVSTLTTCNHYSIFVSSSQKVTGEDPMMNHKEEEEGHEKSPHVSSCISVIRSRCEVSNNLMFSIWEPGSVPASQRIYFWAKSDGFLSLKADRCMPEVMYRLRWNHFPFEWTPCYLLIPAMLQFCCSYIISNRGNKWNAWLQWWLEGESRYIQST